MSVSVTVRPGDSYISPTSISSKYLRSPAMCRVGYHFPPAPLQVVGQFGPVLGQVASQTRHEGASDARRTPCTLSVVGDRVNAAVRAESVPPTRRAVT